MTQQEIGRGQNEKLSMKVEGRELHTLERANVIVFVLLLFMLALFCLA